MQCVLHFKKITHKVKMRKHRYFPNIFNELFDCSEIEKHISLINKDMISTDNEYIKGYKLNLKMFDHLWQYAYPGSKKLQTSQQRQLVVDGTWDNLGGLLERAISITGGLERQATVGRDFSDFSDAKLVSVRTASKGKSYSAPVTNIHRKKGYLRVVCYERKQDKFYYFLIPGDAYSHIEKTSNIEIPFNLNGNPRKQNNCNINWWNFEVETFTAVAKPILLSISLPA
jgi:hypothetical protein